MESSLLPQKNMPCVVGIRLSDNEMDHTIYIFDNWIFKSNFEKALPLSQESLDICASSSDQKTKFTNVTRGHLLTAHKTVVQRQLFTIDLYVDMQELKDT